MQVLITSLRNLEASHLLAIPRAQLHSSKNFPEPRRGWPSPFQLGLVVPTIAVTQE